jgi:hypothetical protein
VRSGGRGARFLPPRRRKPKAAGMEQTIIHPVGQIRCAKWAKPDARTQHKS